MRQTLHWMAGIAAGTMLLAACDSSTGTVNTKPPTAGKGGGGNVATAPGGSGGVGGSTGDWKTQTKDEFCAGHGPIVTIPGTAVTSSYQTCTGRLAESHFLNALCTCEDASVNGVLSTHSFNSKTGSVTELKQGGSVGVNRKYGVNGLTDIGGALSVAGPDKVLLIGDTNVGGDLRVQGAAQAPGATTIGRDLWFANGFALYGVLNVGRDMHGAGLMPFGLPVVKGKTTTEAVTVTPPCPCGANDIIDVDTLVTEAKTRNDDVADKIDPTMLNSIIGNVEVTLPCGRIYFEQIGGIGNVVFNVTGRVAVFISGDVANTGNLNVKLAPGAEIDYFISGNLKLTGNAAFGSKERPAATRIYLGGSGDVYLTGFTDFVGNLYAPRSLVQGIGYTSVYGSIFARNFVSPANANFYYDSAILTVGDSCEAPPTPPTTCSLCGSCAGGTACVDGKCGACRTDADCCSQLACVNGKCVSQEEGVIY